jgi:hypothetical protein
MENESVKAANLEKIGERKLNEIWQIAVGNSAHVVLRCA